MSALQQVQRFVSNTGVRVYRIPCQVFDSLTARVYLLLGDGVPTLVDAGSGLGASTRQILDGIETVRREFSEAIRTADVRRIIVTHAHLDHVGGLPELVECTGAETAVHMLDAKAVAARREYTVWGNSRLDQFLRQAGVGAERRRDLLKGLPFGGMSLRDVPVGRMLADGDEIDGLRIFHTPGHSPGLICIGVGDILLSSDHILSQTLPHQWPESITACTGLGHFFDSLEKIRRTSGFTLALAAHEQVIHDVYRRIETIRAAHHRRLERLLETVREAGRPMSIDEIVRKTYPALSGFRAALAYTEVGTRVEHLYQRNQLAAVALDDLERLDGESPPVYRYVVA